MIFCLNFESLFCVCAETFKVVPVKGRISCSGSGVNLTSNQEVVVGINTEAHALTQQGHKGKKGKPGRENKDSIVSKRDAMGKVGEVAFVIYGPKGYEESGGFPYRLTFPDDAKDANITPLIEGLEATSLDGDFVFGQVPIHLHLHVQAHPTQDDARSLV